MEIIETNAKKPSENPFIFLKQLFTTYNNLDLEIAKKGIKLCDELLLQSNFSKINKLHEICYEFIPNFPLKMHNVIKAIMDVLSYIEFTFMISSNNLKHVLQLQLNVMNNSLVLTECYIQLGLPREAFNFLIHSINQNPINKAQIPLPVSFWELAIQNNIPNTRKNILQFATNQFYLTRILGLPLSNAHSLYQIIEKWIKFGGEATKNDINCISQYTSLLALSVNYTNKSKDLLDKLKLQFDIEKDRNPDIAIMLIELFVSNFGELHNEPKVKWAKEALKINEIHEHPERKMSLELTLLLDGDEFKGEAIKNCLTELLDYLNGKTTDKITFDFLRQRSSEFLTRSIRTAILFEEYRYALDYAYLWRTYTNNHRHMRDNDNEAFLICVPNFSENKMIYLLEDGDEIECFQYKTKNSLETLLESKDAFEGTWNVLVNQNENTEIKPVDARVNIDNSDSYYKNLNDYYLPQEIAKRLNKIPNNKRIRLLETTWLSTPLTALISQNLNREISILVEGEQIENSKIKKALIWCDPGSNLFDAHLEKEALEFILNNNGIEFDVFTCNECTKEEFINRYSSDEYDLIWLMCHGNFDFDIPSNSSLNVGPDEYVNLNQLIYKIPERDKKRILVLNACQSGCSSIRYNAMGFVGLGPGLTNKYQSVVGHLWPVDSFAAGVFGTLLVNELASGNPWDLSLNNSIRIMSSGIKEIQKNTKDISNLSIVNSLNNRHIDWSKMVYWSSPVIFR